MILLTTVQPVKKTTFKKDHLRNKGHILFVLQTDLMNQFTCKQRPPLDKYHILFVPLNDLMNKFICKKRPPAFKDHFWVFPWVVFEDRIDCN
jgi:hypothetical protein